MKSPRWFSPNRFFSILRIASGGALLSAATAMGLMAVLTGPSIATADDTRRPLLRLTWQLARRELPAER